MNNKVILAALIGLVIGAVVMGVLDVVRPKPLFSKADTFGPQGAGVCVSIAVNGGSFDQYMMCQQHLGSDLSVDFHRQVYDILRTHPGPWEQALYSE